MSSIKTYCITLILLISVHESYSATDYQNIVGLNEEQVIEILGEKNSTTKLENKSIVTFKNDFVVVFEDDKAISISGIDDWLNKNTPSKNLQQNTNRQQNLIISNSIPANLPVIQKPKAVNNENIEKEDISFFEMLGPKIIIYFILTIVSLLGGLTSCVLFIVSAFRKSVTWGICVAFIPFATFFYLYHYWEYGKVPFYIWIFSVALLWHCQSVLLSLS